MNLFRNAREFFWPLLEKGEIIEPSCLNVSEITIDSSHLQKTLEYVFDCYNSEADRRKSIEGKASLFIGTISVVTSVVLGVTSILVKENDFDITISALIILLFILTLYMSRTIWFSIQALERKNYYSISVNDFLLNDSNDEYYKKLKIVSYVIYIICSLIALLFPIKTEAGFATGRSVGFVYVVSTLCMMIWLIPIIKNFKSISK